MSQAYPNSLDIRHIGVAPLIIQKQNADPRIQEATLMGVRASMKNWISFHLNAKEEPDEEVLLFNVQIN